MRKLVIVAAIAGLGYLAYRKVSASKNEQDLWQEASEAPDLA